MHANHVKGRYIYYIPKWDFSGYFYRDFIHKKTNSKAKEVTNLNKTFFNKNKKQDHIQSRRVAIQSARLTMYAIPCKYARPTGAEKMHENDEESFKITRDGHDVIMDFNMPQDLYEEMQAHMKKMGFVGTEEDFIKETLLEKTGYDFSVTPALPPDKPFDKDQDRAGYNAKSRVPQNQLTNPFWMAAPQKDEKGSYVYKDKNVTFEIQWGKKAPNHVDARFLLAMMAISQQSRRRTIKTKRFNILKLADAVGAKDYKRLLDSLTRWQSVGYTITDNDTGIVDNFGVINESKYDPNSEYLSIELNKRFKTLIETSPLYRDIQLKQYNKIKNDLALALYELLIKQLGNNDQKGKGFQKTWRIGLTKVGDRLGINYRCEGDIKRKLNRAAELINKAEVDLSLANIEYKKSKVSDTESIAIFRKALFTPDKKLRTNKKKKLKPRPDA